MLHWSDLYCHLELFSMELLVFTIYYYNGRKSRTAAIVSFDHPECSTAAPKPLHLVWITRTANTASWRRGNVEWGFFICFVSAYSIIWNSIIWMTLAQKSRKSMFTSRKKKKISFFNDAEINLKKKKRKRNLRSYNRSKSHLWCQNEL